MCDPNFCMSLQRIYTNISACTPGKNKTDARVQVLLQPIIMRALSTDRTGPVNHSKRYPTSSVPQSLGKMAWVWLWTVCVGKLLWQVLPASNWIPGTAGLSIRRFYDEWQKPMALGILTWIHSECGVMGTMDWRTAAANPPTQTKPHCSTITEPPRWVESKNRLEMKRESIQSHYRNLILFVSCLLMKW